MKRRLALNTASNVGTLFLKLGITFIMTPVLLSNLGRHDYGIWDMVLAIVGYMGILDLGIRPTVSRYAAMAVARDDKRELAELYVTAWYYLLLVGLVIACSLFVFGVFFSDTIVDNGSRSGVYTLFFMILAVRVFLVFPAYVAESFMEAYQEYYLKNNITIVNSIIGSSLVYHIITPENALLVVAGITSLGVVIKYAFYVIYVHWKRRFLGLKPSWFSFRRLAQLFRFSIKTLVQGLSTRVENSTDSLVIGFILGPALIPLYSIPANLVSYIRNIAYNLTHVFMPYFSGLSAQGETEKVRRVYLLGSKLTVCAVLILAIGVSILGESFLKLWIGEDIAESSAPIIWVLVAFTCLPLLNPYSGRYLTAIDRHGVFAKWGPLVAAANLMLSLWLIHPLGIYGVALGSLLPALIYQPFILKVCCRNLGIPVIAYLRLVLAPCVMPSIVMAGVILLLSSKIEIDSYLELLSIAVMASLGFCVVALATTLSRQERRQVLGLLR